MTDRPARWGLWRGLYSDLPALLLVPASMLAWFSYEETLPRLTALWPSASVAALVDQAETACPGSELAAAGYREPSLVFLVGTDTVLTDGAGAAAHLLGGNPCALALVEKREEPAFLAALPDADPPSIVGEISGFNYSSGRFVDLTLYRWDL